MKRSVFQRRSTFLAPVLATALLVADPASSAGPGWIGPVKVKSLVVIGNGGVNVRTEPDLTGCVSQGGYGGKYASILPTHPGINRIKADLLMAYATNSDIMLYLIDSNCTATELVLGSSL